MPKVRDDGTDFSDIGLMQTLRRRQSRSTADRTQIDYVLVLDRKRARLFRFTCDEMRQFFEQEFAVDFSQWKKKSLGHVTSERTETMRGSQRDAYEHRIEVQYRRFCDEVAKKIAGLCVDLNSSMLFLVGDKRLTSEVQEKMPAPFYDRVMLVPLDLAGLPAPELHQHLQHAILESREKCENDLVRRLLSDSQHTVIGIDETLAQIQKGRVRTILLTDNLHGDIRECPGCGLMSRSADPVCPDCRKQRRLLDLRAAILELARINKAGVHIVSGAASNQLDEAGGLGGWLRGRTQAQLR